MTETSNPTILEVTQEDIPDFSKVYLVYITKPSLEKCKQQMTLTLKSDLERTQSVKTFDLIYDKKNNSHFFKEMNTYTKKLIVNDLILSNEVFFTKIISIDDYNVAINSTDNKTIKDANISNIKEPVNVD